jgi:AcrR family transcriptional regulator
MINDLPPPLKSVDKRIQKTKRLLLDSFVSLIVEKGYANVTVQDIIDKAKVGRSTFYSHFENKEQVLKGDSMARLLLQNRILTNSSTNSGINFLRLYAHVKANHALAKEIFARDTNVMIKDHIHHTIVFALQTYLKDRVIEKNIDKEMLAFLIEAAAAALTAMLIKWSIEEMPFEVEIMADKSDQLVDSFFKNYFNGIPRSNSKGITEIL